jgi:CheY-like chemotaxis protein
VWESVCDVDEAYGGGEALDKARAARPDLVLLDVIMVIMPDEDGFAVCEKQGRPGAGRCAGGDADQSAR